VAFTAAAFFAVAPTGAADSLGARTLPTFRTTPTSGCGSFPDLVATEHAQALRREQTLAGLVATLQARHDPFGMNAGQISTLQNSDTGIGSLDQKIQGGCYATRAALVADVGALYIQYRVYWLRVPQTQVVAATDFLGDARARVAAAAAKLANEVGTDVTAKADLAAMDQAVASADSNLGVAPDAAAPIAAVPGLQPAQDMTADTAAIEAARADLMTARAALNAARRAGLKVVADLGG
jgi:hypothetical protein